MPDNLEKSYYDILDLNKNCTQEDIKKAYRSLVIKYHPDLHPDSNWTKEKFIQLTEAYSVLNKVEIRKKYDELGHRIFIREIRNGGLENDHFAGFNVSDLFKEFGLINMEEEVKRIFNNKPIKDGKYKDFKLFKQHFKDFFASFGQDEK